MRSSSSFLAALLPLALLPLAGAAPDGAGDVVALQAGRIQLSAGEAIEGGTILVRDGRIAAVGADVKVPPGARVVDYGEHAVIGPGFVAADSSYGSAIPGMRTAEPTLQAIDNFDPYSEFFDSLRAGVTSAYLAPARGRLIAGQGAVVKTGGEPDSDRVVSDSSLVHGSIAAAARRTPGYWVPPVPATVDVGLGVEQPQLPRTTMGAVLALEELFALQGGDDALADEYGPVTGAALRALVDAGAPWRMGADSAEEVRALLGFFAQAKLPLVLDGARGVDEDLAREIAAAGVPVITGPHTLGGADYGKGPDASGPNHALVSTLAAAGARVIISSRRPGDLRFTAALAMRGGGLDRDGAYHAITLGAAEVLGVADRVGSIAVGKDADFVVTTGHPMELASGVLATWIGGEIVWEPNAAAKAIGPTVIEVEELHLGDGHVLRPGQLLIRGGRIQEVGERVAHPPGVTVVRGAAAMPGMIDALGHLGLEGSRKNFSSRFDLKRLVEPGDATDRAVARAGVTTVNLGGRAASGQTMVYKPADEGGSRMILASPAAIRLTWSHAIPSARGDAVRQQLAKAKEYKDKWDEYEQEIAAWKPPAPEPPKEEEATEEEDADEEDEEEEEKKKKKKEKEDKKKAKEPRPVTGEWEGTVKSDELGVEITMRMRLLEQDLSITGYARAEGFEDLFTLEGTREEAKVELTGNSPTAGDVALSLELDEKVLKGTGTHAGNVTEIELTQTSDVYPLAERPERLRPAAPEKAPKGKPKSPGINPDLEPIRQAMLGKGAVFVSVSGSKEAVAAVEVCEGYGIKPVLWNADSAAGAASQVRGRVAGAVVRGSGATWTEWGVPVAFFSGAEEGAGELSLHAANSIGRGMSPVAALRALTSDAARMLGVADRVGSLRQGMDADVLLLDGSPLDVSSSVVRTWVNGKEIR